MRAETDRNGLAEKGEIEMTKPEYLEAVKSARQLFAYVAITRDRGKIPTKISKARAANLVKLLADHAEIDALWASDAREILLIG